MPQSFVLPGLLLLVALRFYVPWIPLSDFWERCFSLCHCQLSLVGVSDLENRRNLAKNLKQWDLFYKRIKEFLIAQNRCLYSVPLLCEVMSYVLEA